MLRKLLFVVMTGVFVCLPLAMVHAEVMHYPTETIKYDPARAYNGVNLFTPGAIGGKTFTFMVDMDGRLVHKWRSLGYSKFLETGRLLTAGRLAAGGSAIQELGWSGGVLWSGPNSWAAMPAEFVGQMQPWGAASQHHDMNRTYNNKLKAYTYMMVASFTRTADLGTALGAAPNPVFAKGWTDDGIIEINSAGQIVWMWTHADHLCQNLDPAKPNYVADLATAPGRLDINMLNYPTGGTPSTSIQSDWTHVNSLNYNKTLGQVTLNSRGQNEFRVIDHDKTFVSTTDFAANVAAAAGPDGDLIYRFGSPSLYNQGAPPAWATNGTTQIWGAHNIQWIEATMYTGGPALPGAGNFLIFDNHCTNANPILGGSELKEINPHVTGPAVNLVYPVAAGYVNPPTAGYTIVPTVGIAEVRTNLSNQVVWRFLSAWETGFASAHISGTQRLPNGNTLGHAGEHAHTFEVTAGTAQGTTPEANAGTSPQLVWEYINPINGGVAVKSVENLGPGGGVFRCHRYSAQMPGLNTRLVTYADGSIQPVTIIWPGTGFTLTGAVPCRSIPCQYVGHP